MNPFQWFGHYIFDPFFLNPFINLLVGFIKLFELVRIPGAFGFAIVALTAFIRLALHPFFDQQIQTTKKMHNLKPHLDKLSLKHKQDPKKLQAEQMRLYREAGINPASGCLLLIIQMPVFIALYQTLTLFLTHGVSDKILSQINSLLYFPFLKLQHIDPWFLGFNLILSPQQSGNWMYYLIPVITGILQYFQVAVTTPSTPAKALVSPKATADKPADKDDFQKSMQTQMKYIFPFMIGWFSFTLPIGLSLYWNIFSLFSIMQYKKAHSKG